MAKPTTWIKAATISSVIALAGCTGAVVGETPSAEFVVPISLEEAYERALAQTNYCLVTEDKFPVTAKIADDQKSANITVRMSMSGTRLADMSMQAIDTKKTDVLVNMWGVNVWDQTAVDAMKAAIEFGVTSCTNYFPTSPTPSQKRR
ncbi:MAG: hypothetical protein R6V42_03305 [Orrella sp.]